MTRHGHKNAEHGHVGHHVAHHAHHVGGDHGHVWYNKIEAMLRNRTYIFILIAVALLVVVALFLVIRSSPSGPQGAPPSVPVVPKQPPLNYAPKGELVSGFPQELILGATTSVANSYSASYDQSLNQYTATFNSPRSMTDLYNAYLAYFKANNWTIVNRITSNPGSRGIYATQGSADATVAIIASGTRSQAQVTYLAK